MIYMISCKNYSNCNLTDINIVLDHYFKNILKAMAPEGLGIWVIFYFILRSIQLGLILFLTFGCFLPAKYREPHIIFCLINLFIWLIMTNKSIFSLFLQYVYGLPYYPEFIPIERNFKIKLTFFVLSISFIFLFYPEFSPYKILNKNS